MAIDNTENPEEGTPRSKKDIRKERRQMRETNRYRESVGGEPFYSKQEIRDVKKPFKAEPGKAMSGTIGGVTYNDPNKPVVSETTYEYQRSGGGSEPSIGPTEITKEQAAALNAEDVNAGEKVRKVIESRVINDPNSSMSDIEKAQQIAKKTSEEINVKDKQIDQEVKETITTPGDGSKIDEVVGQVPQGQTNWTNVTTYGEGYQLPSDEDIKARASQAKQKVPQLVIEKLGVQDYYPEIGRDIAVGTFSGSRIGSQTIYSGAGGLLPLGLYDARKRAIATEIKRKEALMDQLKEIPDISKQFKPYFSAQYVDGLNKFVDAYKDNPDGLMNDPEFRKFQAHYKSIGENFLKVDKDLKDFSELLQPKNGEEVAYATPGMLEIERKFKAGFLPDKIEDWFSGKKNISNLTETVRALPNGYKVIGEKINNLLKTNQIERTIKPKTGEEIDWSKAKEEIDGIAQQVKDGSSDYESYLTVVKKYYDIDVKPLVEQWVKGNSLSALTDKEKDEYIKSLTLFAEAQIPAESMISKIDRQTNENSENWRKQLDLQNSREQRAFEAEQNRLNREDSITKLEMEEMLEKGEKVRTVRTPDSRIGDESPDDVIYNVYDPQQGKFRQVTGSSIKRDQKSGYKYYDRTGKKLFEVPSTPIQYQQGNVTYYNNNGNIKARSQGTGYTTKYNPITGKTDLIPLNVDVSLPITDMTISPNKIDNGRAGEWDITRSKNVSGAAKGTGGTGSYVTGFGRFSSGN